MGFKVWRDRALANVVIAAAGVGAISACSDEHLPTEAISEARQGVTYSYVVDTTIREDMGNQGSAPDCMARGDAGGLVGLSCIIFFSLPGFPQNTVVQAASIKFRVLNSSPQTYNVFALMRDWQDGGATWVNAYPYHPWATPGAKGSGSDRSGVIQWITMSSTGWYTLNLNSAAVAYVQGWIDDPGTNRGFIIAHGSNSDGIAVASAEHPTASYRPTMTISFSGSGGTGFAGGTGFDGGISGTGGNAGGGS